MGLSILKQNLKSLTKLKKKELKLKIFKILSYHFKIQLNIKTYSSMLLLVFKKKIRQNICFLSGKSSSVYKSLNLSRHFFKKLLEKNQIFGIKKITW